MIDAPTFAPPPRPSASEALRLAVGEMYAAVFTASTEWQEPVCTDTEAHWRKGVRGLVVAAYRDGSTLWSKCEGAKRWTVTEPCDDSKPPRGPTLFDLWRWMEGAP